LKSDTRDSLLSNQKFKYFRSLKQKKYRQQESKFLIEGIKFCQEAFNSDIKIFALLYYPQTVNSQCLNDFIRRCQQKNIPHYEISENMLSALSDTIHSQGVLCVVESQKNQLNLNDLAFILALDAARDPGNVGAIIRTADWFGVDAVLLGKDSVELHNPKVLRATTGSVFHVTILENIDLPEQLTALKKFGFTLYAADVHGDVSFNKIIYASRKVLVVGNETQGIDTDVLSLCDAKIKIPSTSQAESLNMSVATGILLSQMVINNGN